MMFFHNSTLPYQFKVDNIGLKNPEGISVTSPAVPILKEFGVFEEHGFHSKQKYWKFSESLLLGLDAEGANFEIVSFICKPKQQRTFLTGKVLGIISYGAEKQYIAVYGKAKEHLWAFVCIRDLAKPTLLALNEIPATVTFKSFPFSNSGPLDLASLSCPKVIPGESLRYEPKTPPPDINLSPEIPSVRVVVNPSLDTLRRTTIILPGEREHTLKYWVQRGVPEKVETIESAALVLGGLPQEAIRAYQNGEAGLLKARVDAAIEHLRKFSSQFEKEASSAA